MCDSTMLETAEDLMDLPRSGYQRLWLRGDSPKTRVRRLVICWREPKLVIRSFTLAGMSFWLFA